MVALGAAGFALAVPAGLLDGMVLCALLQGFGFGLCWPSDRAPHGAILR